MPSEETQLAGTASPGRARFHLSRRQLLLGLGGLAIGGGIGVTAFACLLGGRSPLLVYRGHSGTVNTIAWSPDGQYLASGSVDRTVQIWSAGTGERMSLHRFDEAIGFGKVAWPPDGPRVALASEASVQVWEVKTGRLLTLDQHDPPDGADRFAWSPDGSRLAVDTVQGVQIWSLASGEILLTLPQRARGLAWSPDGTRLAAAGTFSTGSVQIWEANTGSTALTYTGHVSGAYGDITEVAWSPDGKRIASGGFEGTDTLEVDPTVRVWDAATGQTLVTYLGQRTDYSVNAIVWSPYNQQIASCSTAAYIWDVATGNTLASYAGGELAALHRPAFFEALAWSPDGKRLAAGGEDTTVQVWSAG